MYQSEQVQFLGAQATRETCAGSLAHHLSLPPVDAPVDLVLLLRRASALGVEARRDEEEVRQTVEEDPKDLFAVPREEEGPNVALRSPTDRARAVQRGSTEAATWKDEVLQSGELRIRNIDPPLDLEHCFSRDAAGALQLPRISCCIPRRA